jgi:hypothetical protein
MRINRKAELDVGFDGVGTLILQGIRADFVDDADAAPFLLLIDDDAGAFGLHEFHRAFELRAAIAFQRMKHIARQTLRVNAHERRFGGINFSFDERDEFLVTRGAAKACDFEAAEFGW